MVEQNNALVLPWGNNNSNSDQIDRDIPSSLALVLQETRIEVLWELEQTVEEGDEATEQVEEATQEIKICPGVIKWWGGILDARLPSTTTDGEGRIAYKLRYDPDPSLGYSSPTYHSVTFVDEHELFDLEHQEVLYWRKEGDSWEPPEAGFDASRGFRKMIVDGEEIEVFNADAISQDYVEKMEKLTGQSLRYEALLANEIKDFPMDVQHKVADGFLALKNILQEEFLNQTNQLETKGIGADGKETKVLALGDAEKLLERMHKRMREEMGVDLEEMRKRRDTNERREDQEKGNGQQDGSGGSCA